MSILITDVLLNGNKTDILIKENKIVKIAQNLEDDAEKVIYAKGLAAIPSFVNAHTHAAMTLLRGYADDMPLQKWLEEKIWPTESKLTPRHVYWGTRLACLEMIKTGTTFFNDMYWHYEATAQAIADSGLRASLSAVLIDFFEEENLNEQIKHNEILLQKSSEYPGIVCSVGPHSIFTVSQRGLKWAKDFANKNNLLLHIHLSETQKEVEDCIQNNGMRPVEYLEKLGILGENVVAAHTVWVNDKEIEILRKRNVALVYNPVSNMKLSSKGPFNYPSLNDLRIGLGTDGSSSNNNLDMFEEMKIASLLQKEHHKPTTLTADEIFKVATKEGANIFGLNSGEIREGADADLLLVDLSLPEMTPCYNLTSNLVYSANGSCVKTTICQGKILMENRSVKDEEEIVKQVKKISLEL
ncbi:MAG: amidohydrolase [Nanoarchaeota archaeon]